MSELHHDDLITVCAACLRACCWQGEFYCDGYRDADITKKTVAELRLLNLENPDYWKTDEELAK